VCKLIQRRNGEDNADQIVVSQVPIMTPSTEISVLIQCSDPSGTYVDKDNRETDVPEYKSAQPVLSDVTPVRTPKVPCTPRKVMMVTQENRYPTGVRKSKIMEDFIYPGS
jgi:hypothetical protein